MAIPDTVRLRVYNETMRILGDKALTSIKDKTETRRLLDDVWETDPVQYLLEKAQWRFARRTVQLDYDENIELIPGYQYGFYLPEDQARHCEIATDPDFLYPLVRYRREGEFLYSDITPIYLSYVSNDGDYGNNPTLWSNQFERALSAYIATKLTKRVSKETAAQADYVMQMFDKAFKEAAATDAQSGPTKFPPSGRFVNSRGYSSHRRERGTGNIY